MYQPKTIARPLGRRGPFSSQSWDDTMADVRDDMVGLSEQSNKNEASIISMSRVLFAEAAASWDHAEKDNERVKASHQISARRGQAIDYFIGLRAFSGPTHYFDYGLIPVQRRVRLEPIYGQAMLPVNMLQNRFYYLDPETNMPVVPDELDVAVTGENETGGTVTRGTLKYAFNGNNRDYWIRKVAFPLESDVDYVIAQVDVTVPDLIIDRSNMLVLHPFPLGQLDVLEIKYSTDASEPSINLPEFTPVRGVGYARWHFDDIAITKLRVRFRQPNFIEENGQKVFYLGAQEIGLQLMEVDKTSGESTPVNNNGVICVIEAPDNYKFNYLRGLISSPTYATVTNETGIRFRIFTDEDLTAQVWDSYNDDDLSVTPVYVGGADATKIYVLVTMSYLQASDMSPILDWIHATYDLAALVP